MILDSQQQSEIRSAVISRVVATACENIGAPIEVDRASRIAARLYDQLEEAERERALGAAGLTRTVFRARIDCLIFFGLIAQGWGHTERLESGAVKVSDCPSGFEPWLGYPSSYRIWTASKRVRAACPDEARRYKLAYRAWREARRRYLSTESEETWGRYVQRVTYYTRIARTRRGGVEHFYQRRLYRYMAHELKSRLKERVRALAEMREADSQLGAVRAEIFDTFGVPVGMRQL